ncbi:MAG: FtsQ-type POTRA domain-containing protein [Chthoniobacteraceae bacterium]
MKQAAKPYRNQRVSRPRQRRQQHLLEVSVRASKARELRVRQAIGSCFKVLLFSALLAGAWVGSRHALKEFFWENPSFYLSDVRYVPDGSLTREQVIQTAEIQLNRNILLTNLSAAREKLNKLPQVERVEIDRRLPNRIDIRIEERRPIAWIAAPADPDPSASDSSFLVDARGYVMRSRKVRLEYLHLPIIKGVETENLVPGQKVTTVEMQAALELLRLNSDSTRWQVRTIDLAKGYCLVVTDRNRAEVTFGLDGVEGQLTRLYRLLDHLQQPQNFRGDLRTVNLLVERNTPVTFHEIIPEEPVEDVNAAEGDSETPEEDEGTKRKEEAPAAKPKAETKPKAESKPAAKAKSSPTPRVRRATSVAKPAAKSKSESSPSKRTPVDRLKRPFRANG